MTTFTRFPVLLLTAVLAACQAPYVRVVEYGGGGAAGIFSSEVGGCRVDVPGGKVIEGVTVLYDGKACDVELGP